jgi:rod shape-determining protein MreC
MAVAGDKNVLFASSQADTLRLVLYLTLAVGLMVTDHHSGYLAQLRSSLSALAEPLYRIAQAPVQAARWLHAAGGERVELKRENDALRAELLMAQARLNAARIDAERSLRLEELLQTQQRYRLSGRMVQVFDVDIDPYRQRVLLDAGMGQGVQVGQPVIDAFGLVGQVTAAAVASSTVMLLTDPEHAVPVRIARTGQRAVAFGQGRDDRVLLPTLPINSDLVVGDLLLTSGLGGRFPPGFPVGIVRQVGVDDNGSFAQAWVEPLAQLRLSTELLLLEQVELTPTVDERWPADGIGPPAFVPVAEPVPAAAPEAPEADRP